MSAHGSTPLSARKRTVVPTYNLKILNGLSRRSQGARVQKQRLSGKRRTSDMLCPVSGTQTTESNKSSPLTSPMTSPGIAARETSLQEIPTNYLHELEDYEPSTESIAESSNNIMNPHYECFNKLNRPGGHFYSTLELYARGVWVGYLAPDKQNQAYQDLPSFNELKKNWRNMSLPFPPYNPCTTSVNRQAVCRGCLSDTSRLITLRDIPYAKGKILTIMPLDGNDAMGMFCILLPQGMDRSIKPLQSYCPYEIRNGGDGSKFTNTFNLLSLRDTGQGIGTLETVLELLKPLQLVDVDARTMSRGSPCVGQAARQEDHVSRTASEAVQSIESSHQPQQPLPPAPGRRELSSAASEVSTKRKRQQSAHRTSTWHSRTPTVAEKATTTARQASHPPSESRTQQPTPASPEDAVPPIQRFSVSNSHPEPNCILNDKHAGNVHIIWKFDDDEWEWELLHTMADCPSFSRLLEVLQEEASSISPNARRLAEAKTWRMSYSLNGTRKAIVVGKGTEAAFARLRTTLARHTIWAEQTDATLEVELMPLSW